MSGWRVGLRSVAAGSAAVLAFAFFATGSFAQDSVFEGGWSLQPEASSLSFQSIKDGTRVESSSFAALSGGIDETGAAEIVVHLESVDTKIDLRNVRMRFLFFETFLYPEAKITAQLDAASLSDLPQLRRKTVPLTYTLDLHGITKAFESNVVVTLLGEDMVAVSTAEPISVAVADFGLSEGLKKLEEAAGLPIIPSATVTFDFMFGRGGPAEPVQVVAEASGGSESRAIESTGDFDREECGTRFETLSKSGNVFFGSGSARLDAKSAPLLDELAGVIGRCPGLVIEVGGHTDNVGSDAANQRLSEARAKSVAAYLVEKGIETGRIQPKGYGESQPVADNESAEGRGRNRRIEFAIVDG